MIKYTRTTNYNSDGTPNKVTSVVGVGTTLFTKCNSEQIMSDIWEWIESAYYWDTESGTLKSMWVSNADEVTVDGDFESLKPAITESFFKRNLYRRNEIAEAAAMDPAVKNRMVKVVRGKTSKGAEGKVVVVIERPYGMGWRTSMEPKLGIALDDEMTTYVAKNGKTYPTHKNMIWVWARNCEVTKVEVDYDGAKKLAVSDTESQVADLANKVLSSVRKAAVAA